MTDFSYLGIMGLQPLADQNQFYLAIPESEMNPSGNYQASTVPNQWAVVANVPGQPMRNLDMIFHQEMIEDIESLVAIKTSKIYLSGHSNGASFAEVEMADPTMSQLFAAGFIYSGEPLYQTQFQAINAVPRNYILGPRGVPKGETIADLTPVFNFAALQTPKPIGFYTPGNDQFVPWDPPDGSNPLLQISYQGICPPDSARKYPLMETSPYFYVFKDQASCQKARGTHVGSRDEIVSQLGCSTGAGQPEWAPFDPDNKFAYVYNQGCKGGAQVLTITGTVGSGNPNPAGSQNWPGITGTQGIVGQVHLEIASPSALGPVYCDFVQAVPTFNPPVSFKAAPLAHSVPSPSWTSPAGPDYLVTGLDTVNYNFVDGSLGNTLNPGCKGSNNGLAFNGNYTYQFKLPQAAGPLYLTGYFDVNVLVWRFFSQFGN
jgi:hypothetical protein